MAGHTLSTSFLVKARVKNTFLEFGCQDSDPSTGTPGSTGSVASSSVVDRPPRSSTRSASCPPPERFRGHAAGENKALRGAAHTWSAFVDPWDQDDGISDDGEGQDVIKEATAAVAGRRALLGHLQPVGPLDTGSGLDGRTTVMMRNIPCKYTSQKVMKEINHAGFLGRYDFFYLPRDPRSRSNRGFAFVNFDSARAAEDFFQSFSGKSLRRFCSEKTISVLPAEVQGFEQNASHFAVSLKLRRKRSPESGPLFFRPVPPTLGGKAAHWRSDANDPPLPRLPLPDAEAYRVGQQEQHRTEECHTYAQAWVAPACGQRPQAPVASKQASKQGKPDSLSLRRPGRGKTRRFSHTGCDKGTSRRADGGPVA